MASTALLPLDKLNPAEAWQPWDPSTEQPWDLKWAAHLYRRAAFGAPLTTLREAVRSGFTATFDRLLHGDPNRADRERLLADNGAKVAQRNNAFDLRGWWLEAMFWSPHLLREKMTLFWHNHFATSIVKVGRTDLMYQQNALLRKHALGKFGPLLLDMSHDPAMLVWLDSNSNVKGKPNENYARELMELFSLGVGNYTEQDIRQAARAFTGWHADRDKFYFNAAQHDPGTKTVLGQTGDWDGGDIVRIVLEQPAAARFLVRKLYRFLIGDVHEPPETLLQPLADRFRTSDYDIGDLVATMLRSRHFFSAHAYRQRIKSPVEFLIGAAHDVGQGFVAPRALVPRLEAMGQNLFAPPNVKGWEGGRSWLNTATVLARHNFAQALTGGTGAVNLGDPSQIAAVAVDPAALIRRAQISAPEQIVDRLAECLLQGDIHPGARARLVAFVADGKPEGQALDERVRDAAHALMTMPEYQLA